MSPHPRQHTEGKLGYSDVEVDFLRCQCDVDGKIVQNKNNFHIDYYLRDQEIDIFFSTCRVAI